MAMALLAATIIGMASLASAAIPSITVGDVRIQALSP